MFGFLKNLLGKSGSQTDQGQAPALSSHPVATGAALTGGASAYPGVRRNVGNGNGHNGNGHNGHGNGNGESHSRGKIVEVPLQAILEILPLELHDRVVLKEVGDLVLPIPLERILSQLAQGVVKVTFGDLRQAAPHVFSREADLDKTQIPLPLSEVLSRINPALIKRRRVQRRVEVPDEVSGPFGEDAGEAAVSLAEHRPEPSQFKPAARGASVTPPSPPLNTGSRMNTLTPPPPVPPSAGPATPHIPLSNARLSMNPPPRPAAPVAPAAPQPPPAAVLPPPLISMSRPSLDQAPTAAAPLASPSAPRAAIEPAVPVADANPLILALVSIAEAWPEAVKKEIVQLKLVDAKVALPGDGVERGLRQGRISFPWRKIRSWIKPSPLPTVSAQDDMVLEIPLRIVAPLFLAKQKEASKGQHRVEVDEDIPNLFFGMPQGETSAAVTAPAPLKTPDTNYYVWEDAGDRVRSAEEMRSPSAGTRFVSKYATPNEIVSRAASFDGVDGALIALPDGLLVASKLSTGLNADTVAAFLPQIFGKVSQCTKELRMGELNNLSFTVGNVPWKIFRVNAIFFAAFGRAGEPLPTTQLVALAAELDHKPK
jgi:predicted regulator of Ras-like GTPase activity (Roadblock/LC7/MglB family)